MKVVGTCNRILHLIRRICLRNRMCLCKRPRIGLYKQVASWRKALPTSIFTSLAGLPANTPPGQSVFATGVHVSEIFSLVLRVLYRYLYGVYAYSPSVEMIIERGSRPMLVSLPAPSCDADEGALAKA